MLKKKFRRNLTNCILRARTIFMCITYLSINILIKHKPGTFFLRFTCYVSAKIIFRKV
jgi:hypothetical protein